MMKLLIGWRQHGGSRLDRNLDGEIDHPGAAIMDAVWPKIADAFMRPKLGPQLDELDSLFSRFDQPPGGQYNGWYQYFDRDIRKLLGMPVAQPLNQSYCGGGDLGRCQNVDPGRVPGRRRGADRRAGNLRPGGVARGRDRGADLLRPRPPAHHHALHQPPERHPAGDLLQRPSLRFDHG